MQNRRDINIMIFKDKGIVTKISRSEVYLPKIQSNNKGTKWYQDKMKGGEKK